MKGLDLGFELSDNYEDYFNEVDEVENILRETGFDKELGEYNSNRAFKIENYWGDI